MPSGAVVLDDDCLLAARQQHQLAAVGAPEDVGGEGRGRLAERHLAMVDAEDEVEAPCLLDVVGGDRDRVPLGPQIVEDRQHSLGGGLVDSAQRLVE